MKVKELREKPAEELKNLLNQERSRLNQLRFSAKANQVKNYNEIGQIRKSIARMLTLLKEKELKSNSDK